MTFEPGDYRLDIPTASPFEDLDQHIPLMLSAVDGWLDIPTRWLDDDPDGTAHLYMEDLRAFIQDLPFMMVPIGGILPYSVVASPTTAPPGYLFCQGNAVLIADYPKLFAVIGTTFGSPTPGVSFSLPDLSTRVPVGHGTGFAFGSTGGASTVTLTTAQLPAHSHSILTRSGVPTGVNARLTQSGGDSSSNANQSTEQTGSGQAHENMPPYLTLSYIIRAD